MGHTKGLESRSNLYTWAGQPVLQFFLFLFLLFFLLISFFLIYFSFSLPTLFHVFLCGNLLLHWAKALLVYMVMRERTPIMIEVFIGDCNLACTLSQESEVPKVIFCFDHFLFGSRRIWACMKFNVMDVAAYLPIPWSTILLLNVYFQAYRRSFYEPFLPLSGTLFLEEVYSLLRGWISNPLWQST